MLRQAIHGIFLSAALALAVGDASSAHAQGQQPPPSRIGNVWNGTAHEPNPAAVDANERAAGIAASPEARRRADDTIEQLFRQLENTPGTREPG
jgi:hypothetical protein